MKPAAMKPAATRPAAMKLAMMKPAAWPRCDASETRLLHVDPAARRRTARAALRHPAAVTPESSERRGFVDGRISDLRVLLREGDLLVVNDAATLPASLRGVTGTGVAVEVRLVGTEWDGEGGGCWRAALFGAGDWRQRTEDRPAPPALGAGEELR